MESKIVQFLMFGYILNVASLILGILMAVTAVVKNTMFTAKVSKELESLLIEYKELSWKFQPWKRTIQAFGLFIPFVSAYETFSLFVNYGSKGHWNYLLMIYMKFVDDTVELRKEQK